MDAIKRLVTMYGLEDSVVNDAVGQFTDPYFAGLYDELVLTGSISLEEALKVGVSIEELDIADLNQALLETSQRSVRRVFLNLLSGSYNHLDAFQRNIEADGTECPGQLGLGDGTCPAEQEGSMISQGNRRPGNSGGQDNNGLR